ncbi:MAG: ribonuclease HII [Candidatus Omnitrophica bacterium]|nr:ribonuclease HII [Candidatus Omnitrophota bacterium]
MKKRKIRELKRSEKMTNPHCPPPMLFQGERGICGTLGDRAFQKLLLGRRSARSEVLRLSKLLYFEQILWARGVKYIAGADEVGLGALAGPVVAAAVVFPPDVDIKKLMGLNDSKKLTAVKRYVLNERIRGEALAVGIGSVDVDEIARLNIFRAGQEAMRRAVSNLTVVPEHVLLDGRPVPNLEIPHNYFVKGDALDFSIAAGSIVAKVHRDGLMEEYGEAYPEYGFARHKGYGTEAHWEALKMYGTTPIHRTSYEKLRELSTLEDTGSEEEILTLTP